MITFKQYITEVADKPVDYLVTRNTAKFFEAESTINGRLVSFIAVDMDGTDTWDVEFVETSLKARGHGGKYGATGSGGEFEVASFVMSALKELVALKTPSVITFTADDDNGSSTRARVYERMLQRKLPEYDLDIRKHYSGHKFILRRIEP